MDDVWPELALAVPTFRRPTELKATLEWACDQSLAPGRILVLDNDPEQSAKAVALRMADEVGDVRIDYRALGWNAGPAGSYATAISELQGGPQRWMLCSDDDNADGTRDRVRRYHAFLESVSSLRPTAIGISGAIWDVRRSVARRHDDHELVRGPVSCDVIPGPGLPMYDLSALRELGVGFRPELFFGFEELALGLDIRAAGGLLLVDGPAALERRRREGMSGLSGGTALERRRSPWRTYFRHRNRILLAREFGSRLGTARLALRSGASAVLAVSRRDPAEAVAAFRGVVDGTLSPDRSVRRYIP